MQFTLEITEEVIEDLARISTEQRKSRFSFDTVARQLSNLEKTDGSHHKSNLRARFT